MESKKKIKNIIPIIMILLSIILIVLGIYFNISKNKETKTTSLSEPAKTTKIEYKVKKGETLNNIATKYNLQEEILKNVNNLKDNKIKENDILTIPNVTLYKVNEYDNLDSISNKFSISKNNLKLANDLKNDNLKVSQVIKIPNTMVHVVKKNDTIESLSNEYNVPKEALIKYNTENINENDVIYIPLKMFSNANEYEFVEISTDIFNNIDHIMSIAQKLYKEGTYLKYKKNSEIITMTINNVMQEGYKDISNYTINCTNESEIIMFNPNDKEIPIMVKGECKMEVK